MESGFVYDGPAFLFGHTSTNIVVAWILGSYVNEL